LGMFAVIVVLLFMKQKEEGFQRFTMGKVIMALLAGCIALFLSWEVSRMAFQEILKNLENLSKPVETLHIVNKLFRDITVLEQLQRSQALKSKGKAGYSDSLVLRESVDLRRSLDVLQKRYSGDSSQTARINSMKEILDQRDSLFNNYITVRQGLVSGEELVIQLSELTDIYSNSPVKSERIITTEKRISTVTVTPKDTVVPKENKGFLGRIFGKRKSAAPAAEASSAGNIVEQRVEVDVKTDTLAKGAGDSLKHELDRARRSIVRKQKIRSTEFVNREAELANAGNILMNKMLSVLQEVEKEAVRQVDYNNLRTKNVVKAGANEIILILLLFVCLTALLLYFILTDISKSAKYRRALFRAKEEAEHHSAVRQRFLANMSHEIRTPLQSILGYSEKIRSVSNPVKSDIDAIYFSSEHLLHVVNEILDYSRLSSGKFNFVNSNFNIIKLLEEVITVMHPHAEKKAIDLILNQEIHVGYVYGDPFRLKQVLYNLLSNAIKFTTEGNVVLEVSAKEEGEAYSFIFSVKDTGIGIPEDSLHEIFKQFEQVNSPLTNVTEGTGLGLTIVKELISLQGGHISVSSVPGEGSCFTVSLTFGKPENEEVLKLEETENFQVLSPGLRVFLVDDDHLILQLCSSILDKYHVEHSCYSSPKDLLDDMISPGEAVVFADMRMPGMSGIELCAELRKRSGNLKIYALTAQALPEERKAILESGFDGLIMKPFRESDIINLLKEPVYEEVYAGNETGHLIDLSVIEQMTFGDKDQMIKILDIYVRDSSTDLEELALKSHDDPEIAFLLHRLAGRCAQIGSSILASYLRQLETDFRDETIAGDDARVSLEIVAEEVKELIDLVIIEIEINHQSDTSPSYNTTFSGQY